MVSSSAYGAMVVKKEASEKVGNGGADPLDGLVGVVKSLSCPPVGNVLVALSKLRAARANCRRLLRHWVRRADSRAAWTAGSNRLTRTPIMAMTTNSSIRVKPGRERGRRRCVRNVVFI